MGFFDKLFGSEKKQEDLEALSSKHVMNAIAVLMNGETKEALAHIDKALLVNPQNTSALELRETIYKKWGK